MRYVASDQPSHSTAMIIADQSFLTNRSGPETSVLRSDDPTGLARG